MPRSALRSTLVALAHGAAAVAAGAERVVTLSVPDGPRTVTIEWRALEPTGTRLVAAREVTLQGRVPVTVPEGPSVVRVVEAGGAPRSFFVPAGAAPPAFALGPRARGGEVLGRLVAGRYRPTSLRLSGPSKGVISVEGDATVAEEGVFQHGPLPPGRYDIIPVYRGGAPVGEFLTVRVEDGRSAEAFPLQLPATGAARIDLDGALCGEGGLKLVLAEVGGSHSSVPLARAPEDSCALEIEGLAPGEWRMAAAAGGARNDPRGEARFAITADQATDVAVRAYARVVGSVTVGGEPAVGLPLRFEHGVRQWHVATDAEGGYEVVLGEPGEYAVAVGGGDLPSRAFRRAYAAGEQREDVELATGAIAVVVRAEDAPRTEPVDLGLFAADGRRRAGRVQLPGGRGSFGGLDLGTYTLTASTASGLRSREPAQVELTASSPTASVELVLERGGGTLRVVGAGGSPLAGASATVAGRALAERAPGVFGLDAVPAGERVVAQAPGHVAACRVLGASDREPAMALLVPSDLLELTLRADAPWQEALLVGLPGSDCPVSIDDVEPQVRTEGHGVTIALRLPRGSFTLALGGEAHPVAAPGKVEIP